MPKTRQDLIDLGFTEQPRDPPPGGGEHPIVTLIAPDGTLVAVVNDTVSDVEYAEHVNRVALHDKLVQARDYFSENYRNWPDMTNAQKDAANRQAQRALANVCRRLLNDLSTGGD